MDVDVFTIYVYQDGSGISINDINDMNDKELKALKDIIKSEMKYRKCVTKKD